MTTCPRCGAAIDGPHGACDRPSSSLGLALYAIIFSNHPQDEAERVVASLKVPKTPPRGLGVPVVTEAERRATLARLVAEIRAELATPTRRVREVLPLSAPEQVVSEADVREFLRLVADGLERA